MPNKLTNMKRKNLFRVIWLVIAAVMSQLTFAFVPIEGIVLGKVNSNIQKDPLDFIFVSKDQFSKEVIDHRRFLNLYHSYISDGESLASSCRGYERMKYKDSWTEERAVSSIMATLQYFGLDLSARSIGKYAKTLDFSKEEYDNLVNRLVNNYCSKNLTVTSLKLLKDNLYRYYEKAQFSLPSVSENSFFPQEFKQMTESLKVREREMVVTTKLFRSLCSWDQEATNPRLMSPLLKNPFIMAKIFQMLKGLKSEWDPSTDKVTKTNTEDGVRVLCKDGICRPVKKSEFYRDFPLSIGTTGIDLDLEKMYCTKFRDLKDEIKSGEEEHVQKWAKFQTLEDANFIVSQMIALTTKVPHFLLSADKFTDFKKIARLGINETWNNWAHKSNDEFVHELFYEESLNVSIIDRSQYFFFLNPQFKVMIDLSLGEIDKTTIIKDKIGFVYQLSLNKSFLKWIRKEYNETTTKENEELIVGRFMDQISHQLNKLNSKLSIVPWNDGLDKMVARELLEQLRSYQGNFFEGSEDSIVQVPLEFRYGLFALKYINFRAKVNNVAKENKNKQSRESKESLESRSSIGKNQDEKGTF